MFDPVSFLYAFLSRISKAKNCKDKHRFRRITFSVLRWKNNLPYADTKISRISEKQRIKLDIFVNFLKKKHFFTLQNNIFFLFQFVVLKECNTFDSNSLSFIPSCCLQPAKNCFCATESDIDLQTILHASMNYRFQYWDLHWALVKCQRPAEECTKNLADSFHCRHTYIR